MYSQTFTLSSCLLFPEKLEALSGNALSCCQQGYPSPPALTPAHSHLGIAAHNHCKKCLPPRALGKSHLFPTSWRPSYPLSPLLPAHFLASSLLHLNTSGIFSLRQRKQNNTHTPSTFSFQPTFPFLFSVLDQLSCPVSVSTPSRAPHAVLMSPSSASPPRSSAFNTHRTFPIGCSGSTQMQQVLPAFRRLSLCPSGQSPSVQNWVLPGT